MKPFGAGMKTKPEKDHVLHVAMMISTFSALILLVKAVGC